MGREKVGLKYANKKGDLYFCLKTDQISNGNTEVNETQNCANKRFKWPLARYLSR